jgi:enolase-phosphatase E1
LGPVVRAVVLDIEGTTGSLSHVRDVLFPYARRRLPAWAAAHHGTPAWRRLREETAAYAARPGLGDDAALSQLIAWSDADVKAPPLKHLQGLIWAEGYACGELHGHVYDEVPGALRAWRAAGLALYIYSSGSAAAQHDWFAHTAHGDLTALLDGYFDLGVGPKQAPASYRAIAAALGLPAPALLFVSDVRAELDAARAATWRTAGVRRPNDPRGPLIPGHPTAASLDELPVPGAGQAAPSG